MASCHTHAILCQSSHRIHLIHRSFWRRIFSHRFRRFSQIFRLRFCLLICAYPCLSVGGFLCQKVLCVPRILWDTLSFCFVGASVGGTSPLVSVRHPIGLRPPSNQIASATRSDSVRHPIRFRSLHDAISSVCILRRLRCNTQCVYVLHPFMFAKLRNKFDF